MRDPNIIGDAGPTDVAPGRDPEPELEEKGQELDEVGRHIREVRERVGKEPEPDAEPERDPWNEPVAEPGYRQAP